MVALPSQIFISLLLGFLALAALTSSLCFFWKVLRQPRRVVQTRRDGELVEQVQAPVRPNQRKRAGLLALATALLLFSLAGRHLVLLSRPSGANSSDQPEEQFGTARKIRGASGAELAVEESGPAGAPRLLFTHGWGADRREWSWAKRELSQNFRVVTWDLPGLGQSAAVPNGDYALETLARELQAVLQQTGDSPAVLVGHSIGGMTNLTFCRLFPNQLGPSVKGIVQFNTTYTNPVKTTSGAQTQQALQKPLYEPLLYVIPFVSPVVRALNWLAYQSGLTHLQNASSSFAGAETREQLDFASKYYYRSSPAVVSRGMLGMLHWDATDVLPRIPVPVLIVSGEQDTTTLPSASDHMEQTIPTARRVSVSPAAHLGPIEQHQRYNAAIREFTTGVAGGAVPAP